MISVSRYEIRIGGFGGQGVVTMAVVMGETASLFDKKFVVQTHLAKYAEAAISEFVFLFE